MSEDEKVTLIGYLRNEAYAVRDCFTRYSIQALAVSGGLVVAIAKFQTENPYTGLISIFPIILIILVLQMGVHKFATSNRLLGYELHLQRTAHYISRDNCQEIIENVGWEEAMRAWRIVQPTLWHNIYEPQVPKATGSSSLTGLERIYRRFDSLIAKSIRKSLSLFVEGKNFNLWYYTIATRNEIDRSIESGTKIDGYVGYWFDQSKAFDRLREEPDKFEVAYNPGGYLGTMTLLFVLSIAICVSLQYLALAQIWLGYLSKTIYELGLGSRLAIVVLNLAITIFVIATSFAVCAALRNINSRIQTLESGLLSIHSCAILWEAVVLAHLRALEELHFFDEGYPVKTMHGYTKAIARQANDIAANYVTRIHAWIDKVRVELDKKIEEQDIQIYKKSRIRRRESGSGAHRERQ